MVEHPLIKMSTRSRLLVLLGLVGAIVFSIGCELIYLALSDNIVFNDLLSDVTRNLYFSSGSVLLVAGLWLINEFRKPKISKGLDALVSIAGFGILAYLGFFNLLNCVNALWYFSFRTDHSFQTSMFYAYQGFFWQSFIAIGLGIWLLMKGKEYPQS
jgi:hypothetical protein